MNIQTRGARIHIHQKGTGDIALVFLHYWGGSARTWDSVTNKLSERYKTIALDQRGWGDSTAPAQGYAITDLADDAQDVIDATGLSRFVLVGHSMGGKVAQLLASRRPRGLMGTVLVAPSPPSPMTFSDEQRAQMTAAYDSRESIIHVLENVLTATALPSALREQVIADSLRGAPQAKAAWPNAGMLEDITADVARIDVPVLVIAGEQDKVDEVETHRRELLPRVANARLMVLPGIGHLSPLEAPDALADAIDGFMTQARSHGGSSPNAVIR